MKVTFCAFGRHGDPPTASVGEDGDIARCDCGMQYWVKTAGEWVSWVVDLIATDGPLR